MNEKAPRSDRSEIDFSATRSTAKRHLQHVCRGRERRRISSNSTAPISRCCCLVAYWVWRCEAGAIHEIPRWRRSLKRKIGAVEFDDIREEGSRPDRGGRYPRHRLIVTPGPPSQNSTTSGTSSIAR